MTSSFLSNKRKAAKHHAKKERRAMRHNLDARLRAAKRGDGSAALDSRQRRSVIDGALAAIRKGGAA